MPEPTTTPGWIRRLSAACWQHRRLVLLSIAASVIGVGFQAAGPILVKFVIDDAVSGHTAGLGWLIVGLVAGFLAGQVMKGGGYGLIGDIVMGIIGAFVGGFLFSFLMPGSSAGLIGSIVVAFIGAVVFIAIVRALPGRSPV